MKKIFTLLIGIVFSITILNAQDAPPQAFSFKATIKDRIGTPVVNKTITLRISILKGAANGIVVYAERFRPTTNQYAQIDVEIGRGTVIYGIFSAIDWGADEYYLKVEVDPKGGINYYVMSVSQLLSVPYALFAGNLSGGQDNDDDAENELISNAYLSGTVLTVVEGDRTTLIELSGLMNYFEDDDANPINELQNLMLNGHELTIQNGNTITLPDEVNDADADPINEIQVLSLEGNILTLTTNGSPTEIDLTPYLDNTDSQHLSLNGHELTIQNGNMVTLPDDVIDSDADPLNEIQQLSINGDRITLSRDGGYVEIPVANTVNGMFFYGDKDKDGYGDQYKAIWVPVNVSPPEGYVVSSTDCIDSDAASNPGAVDFCDGTDNNCNGEIDEDCQAPECYQALIQLFQCLTESDCETNDPDCLYLSCYQDLEGVQICEDYGCIIDLLMDPENLVNEAGLTPEEKATYVIAQCTSPDVDKDGYSIKEGDCNDSDPSVHPGATEICGDGTDQNCNGRDQTCGDDDDDEYLEPADCNDSDPSIHPDQPDGCDGVDNDCDGETDEDGDWATYYLDSDHDGYGNKDVSESFCGEPPEGYVSNNEDCNDSNPEINPDAFEAELDPCGDGIDQDCSGSDLTCGELEDNDGDGFSEIDGDCDDTNPDVHPGVAEICDDGKDQDCNGSDVACSDLSDDDGDGWTEVGGDCDDTNPNIHPGAPEICDDNIDQNCDGNPNDGCCRPMMVQLLECMDKNCTNMADPMCVMANCSNEYFMTIDCIDIQCIMNQLTDPDLPFNETWTNDQKAVYLLQKCGVKDEDGDNFSPSNGDCNDSDPSVYPGAPEICGDGIDQNCNGTDAGCDDVDEDGYTTATGDCNDNDRSIYPGADESCDNKDNDCDGTTDEGLETNIWFRDADEDGYGNPELQVASCMAPAGYVDVAEDCDDTDPDVHRAAEELCDGKDNNCNGEIDEGAGIIWFVDDDDDGYGTNMDVMLACDPPEGYVDNEADCDDSNSSIYPGAAELCDNLDNDCDGETDEDLVVSVWYEDIDHDGYGNSYSWVEGCSAPEGYIDNSQDCNDNDAAIYPGAIEICGDDTDHDCDGYDCILDIDDDRDGYSENNGDCNDADALIYPGAYETCADGVDHDCDGFDCIQDKDNDGDGYSENMGDCNDYEGSIHPGASEICGDGIDHDCDGYDCILDIDDDRDGYSENNGDCNDADGLIYPGAHETCADGIDHDCDGFDCIQDKDNDGDGYSENMGDCNDENAAVNPGAAEICGNGIDEDCDGNDPECLPTISFVYPSSLTMNAGGSASVYVELVNPADPDEIVINVTSSNSCVSVPGVMIIPAGSKTGGTQLTAISSGIATITFTLGSQQVSMTVIVN